MRKAIILLGYIFLALIAVMAVSFGVLLLQGKKLDRESKAFVDSSIRAIATDWAAAELQKRASPEFENDVDFDEIQEYFDSLRELGKFESFDGATGESTITLSPRYGYEITAEYRGFVNFDSGFAEIQVLVIKLEGRWQILDFRVSPQMLSEDKNII